MKNLRFRSALLALALLTPLAASAAAQGSPGPRGRSPVRMTDTIATVEIVDGIATTRLSQTLRNDGGGQEEAVWLLPLPPGAAADGFVMTVDGVRMEGEVLAAGQAREVYESIVRRRQDPGLLEYMGQGCLRARIFPILPRGEVKVDVRFRQVLPELNGLLRWSFALDAAGLEGRPPESVVLDLSIRSKRPIRNVFSPTNGLHVIRKSDHEAVASFEGRSADLDDGELAVFYGLSEKEFGLDLLSYRQAGDGEGTFLMLLAPKREWGEKQVLKKSITFVLDTSGSMSGQKIVQARSALRFFLESLRPEDRFNVIPFSTEARPFFKWPLIATKENIDLALARTLTIEAIGGTNIDDALTQGLAADPERGDHVPILVFLTDGQPTVGQKDLDTLLRCARERNAEQSRIFVFGVGSDVNTHLLDRLAAEGGGTRNYVREEENIEEKTGVLFAKLSHPVMTDLELKIDGVEVSRMVPAKLPDLFIGTRLEVFGRYLGEGAHAIRLSGRVGDTRREYVYEGTFTAAAPAERDFLPALWAQRRVGVLLDAVRLNGAHEELLDEIRTLGRRYHIVTPYTSHLIVEEGLRVSGGTARPSRRGPGAPLSGGGGGPGTPGPAGPTSAGPAAPSGGRPAAPMTGGGGMRRAQPVTLDEIAERLSEAGVLPSNASDQELRDLAGEVAKELRAAGGALGDLGSRESGEDAVSDSAYLARLVEADRSGVATGSDGFFLGRGERKDGGKSSSRVLLDLFTRKVKDKVFHLREGVWVDREITEADKAEPAKREQVTVTAYSDEYFALLASQPTLAPYFAFSPRLQVLLDGTIYEVKAPVEQPAPVEKGEKQD